MEGGRKGGRDGGSEGGKEGWKKEPNIFNLLKFSGVRGICFLVKNGLETKESISSSNFISLPSEDCGVSDNTVFTT